MGKGILFKKGASFNLEAYIEVDYASSIVDKRSTFSYFIFVGGNLVTRKRKKQPIVARSSA